jgi:hypothetical protein
MEDRSAKRERDTIPARRLRPVTESDAADLLNEEENPGASAAQSRVSATQRVAPSEPPASE